MIATRRGTIAVSRQYVRSLQSLAPSQPSQYGRTAVYRRIEQSLKPLSVTARPSSLSSLNLASSTPPQALRSLHTSRILFQQADPKEKPPKPDVKDPPRQPGEQADQEAKSDEQKSSQEGESKEGESKEGEKKEKKDLPPPPPHGDKTPWQVFRETFSSELKASKEWEESTKQLAGEVQELRESERVKQAGKAYDATIGAAGRSAKTAAKVVGTGAAWTWETPVVQGVRKGVNATGRGIEQATRPIRESETFKTVTEAIDDGNSSRYGGWIEKEERRRLRAIREAKEGGYKPAEPVEEDPK